LAIVNFVQFHKIYRCGPKFWATIFPEYRLCINFATKLVGLHFGLFFHNLIWSPWSTNFWQSKCRQDQQNYNCSTIVTYGTLSFYKFLNAGLCNTLFVFRTCSRRSS
jgi:hypothetical protein